MGRSQSSICKAFGDRSEVKWLVNGLDPLCSPFLGMAQFLGECKSDDHKRHSPTDIRIGVPRIQWERRCLRLALRIAQDYAA
jgi:hypothetical protein